MTSVQTIKENNHYDAVLVGAGIMSGTLALLLAEVLPDIKILIIEKLNSPGSESTGAFNNAGTGHAANCELNYTPIDEKGNIKSWNNQLCCPSILKRYFSPMAWFDIDPTSTEGAEKLPYKIEDFDLKYSIIDPGVPVGWWNSVGSSFNAFFSNFVLLLLTSNILLSV